MFNHFQHYHIKPFIFINFYIICTFLKIYINYIRINQYIIYQLIIKLILQIFYINLMIKHNNLK